MRFRLARTRREVNATTVKAFSTVISAANNPYTQHQAISSDIGVGGGRLEVAVMLWMAVKAILKLKFCLSPVMITDLIGLYPVLLPLYIRKVIVNLLKFPPPPEKKSFKINKPPPSLLS